MKWLRPAVLAAPLFLSGFCVGAAHAACVSDCIQQNSGGPVIHGSGTMKTEQRNVGNFTAIRAEGSFELVIERTGTSGVSVTGDDNLLPFFTSAVEDGTLVLSSAQGKSFEGKIPTYHVTVADLRGIETRGAGTVTATKLDGDALTVSLAGAGKMQLGGRVTDLGITISGAGNLDAAQLQAKNVKIKISGAAQAVVSASDTLDADVSGAASVRYLGSPKLTSHDSGAGSLKQKS